MGKLRNHIIDSFRDTPYKLACTATPSPNDFTELGNQSEFLGVMSRPEMLAMYFINDMGTSQKWRIKKHAGDEFWKWVCSWGVMLGKPSDLDYSDKGFRLPKLNINEVIVESDYKPEGVLFSSGVISLSERREARKSSVKVRAEKCAEIVNNSKDQYLIWCGLNDEGSALRKLIPDAVEVAGSDSPEDKENRMLGFADGKHRVLITKAKIAGFGMNWQNCHKMIFCGMSDSYEQYYQAVRRCWRYGQKKPVHTDIVISNAELPILDNILRKERDAMTMGEQMRSNIKAEMNEQIKGVKVNKAEYTEDHKTGDGWELYLGDCVEVARRLDDESIDFSIFSPPFASLYTYSNSDRDMGNCRDHDDFYEHFKYLVTELYRIIKPGRNVSFHCMNLPTSKVRDGHIGLRDFRGELIRMFSESGFIYHSEVCIWKDPVLAMQRTKALGLLHKQLKKDSTMSRQGLPDYLVTMRKPGENPKRVENTNESFPVKDWQELASPIWMDINPSDTLQYRSAREDKDEKHICPLQLEVIRRAMRLWSTDDDLVFSPFTGIGSELYVALEMGRRAVGSELKPSYYKQACLNLESASRYAGAQGSLFEDAQ